MDWIWNAVVAILCLIGTIANVVFVWWKVSSANLLLTANLEKLTISVDNLLDKVNAHTLDTTLHRTHDFEDRLTAFMRSVEDFSKQNRDEHTAIIDLIRELTRAKV
jgi:hypothetical protein